MNDPDLRLVGRAEYRSDRAHQVLDRCNRRDLSRLLLLYRDDAVVHSPVYPDGVDMAMHGRFLRSVIVAFPNLHFEHELTMAHGDQTVTQFRIRGTHRGDLTIDGVAVYPPTARPIDIRGVCIHEFDDRGAIRSERLFWDTERLLDQLRLELPEPAGVRRAASARP